LKLWRARLSTNSDFYDSLLAIHLLWCNPLWEFVESETRVATAWQSFLQPILWICRIWDQSCNCMTIFLQPILWICRIWDQKHKCFWKYKFLGICSSNSFHLLTYYSEQVYFFFQFCDGAQVLLIIGKYI
jgi:hypothetical protein